MDRKLMKRIKALEARNYQLNKRIRELELKEELFMRDYLRRRRVDERIEGHLDALTDGLNYITGVMNSMSNETKMISETIKYQM